MVSRTRARLSRIRAALSAVSIAICPSYPAAKCLTSPQIRWYPCLSLEDTALDGDMINHTIGFIGSGQMARALAQGFVTAGLVEGGRIVHCDPVQAAAEQFSQQVAGSRRAAHNADAVGQSNVVFLAVKPQNMP